VAARDHGLETVGTIGLLDLAAQRGLIDLQPAFAALRATNFRHPPALLDALLAADRARREAR
jgi:predicted nucleic acid-binding protein